MLLGIEKRVQSMIQVYPFRDILDAGLADDDILYLKFISNASGLIGGMVYFVSIND